MRFEREIEIQASPETIHAILVDIQRWPEWTPTAKSAKRLDQGPLREGSSARLAIEGAPEAVWTVTEVRDGRGFTWEASTLGVKTVAGHEIEPLAGGSQVRLTLDQTGLMATLFRPMIARVSKGNLAREAEGLKARAEAVEAAAKVS